MRLTLEPVLAARTADRRGGTRGLGFALRLVDGPAITRHDPLLRAFGAEVVDLLTLDEHAEALQDDSFDPGRRVRLEPEPFDPHDPDLVGVWDVDAVRQAGELPGGIDGVVAAGIDQGLPMEGVVLWEEREPIDDRRTALSLLVHSPRFVTVEGLDELRYERPRAVGRPRLVLFADGSGDVRWWDPTAAGGPVDLGDLPVSLELAADLERLRRDYADLRERIAVIEGEGCERFGQSIEREALEEDARGLWRRARIELGRRFAIGFLGQGMTRPVWSPEALEPGEDDDVTWCE